MNLLEEQYCLGDQCGDKGVRLLEDLVTIVHTSP